MICLEQCLEHFTRYRQAFPSVEKMLVLSGFYCENAVSAGVDCCGGDFDY